MRKEFQRELENSLYVHRPLPLHREREMEARFPGKKVLASRPLEACGTDPHAEGTAALTRQEGTYVVEAPLRSDRWPESAPADGDYCNFGTARITFPLDREDWRSYNRVRLWVRPHILGARILHLNASVRNCGEVPVPDPYFREGSTVFDLENDAWTEWIWEFNAMPRDAVCEFSLYVFCNGHDTSAGETLTYTYRDITLERVDAPEHELGWVNPNPGIRLSTVGYWPDGKKTAVATTSADTFQLVSAVAGEVVLTAPVERVDNELGSFTVLDFSSCTRTGSYFLRAGDLKSPVFEIAPRLCEESVWQVLNFLFCERCGFPVPGKHGACHQDIVAHHNGVSMSFSGGWHDAGDVSQQAAQTGEITQALFENARRQKKGSPLCLRLMEEAQWGLDFILRTRFGDGYRATSAGATRFTDGLIGNFDDVEARVHNHSYENFLFAGVEAYAAETLRGYDDNLADCALKAAREDFGFAVEKFAETGVDPAHMYEHTYNSGLSQYYAVIVWAASCLYAAAGDEYYAATARDYAGRLLACQETGGAGIGYTGFFYRDESHRAIVHFNHQSREYQFVQALDVLCRTQPHALELPRWEQAMGLYGGYLKKIAGNTAPYGMLPAGIHHVSEIDDEGLFPYVHVLCDYQTERENYRQQLESGKQLGNGYVLRKFPVWFSFRGNTAVILAAGKAAAILGRYFGDRELIQIAREQLYWMWGKNPFGQSLVYGSGSNYCRQYAVLCGECVGEVPVGIETAGNQDFPYWPQNNNATYKEVWVGSACRWLWVCADLM